MQSERLMSQLPESYSDFLQMKGDKGTYVVPGPYSVALKMRRAFDFQSVMATDSSGGVLSLQIHSEIDFNNAKKVLARLWFEFLFFKIS